MNKTELEYLRSRVSCASVLEHAGFSIDVKESTRRAMKYRRESEIVIVNHEGRGWFDVLSDAKGDVFSLVGYLHGGNFAESLARVMHLVGYAPQGPEWQRPVRARQPSQSISKRWHSRQRPSPGSLTWHYLSDERFLPEELICAAVRQDVLREGPQGTMWAAHTDENGVVSGWEGRGPQWRGFARDGAKVLFRFGAIHAVRFCVTEAAIDAMSLAAIEEMRSDSIYLSTGGGWAPSTEAAIRVLASREGSQIVAATDNNAQGEVFAGRLKVIADEFDRGFERLRSGKDDWNKDLEVMSSQRRNGFTA